MSKVKLIIGTVNNCSVLEGEKTLQDYYEKSYMPFLKMLHSSNIPMTMYYSGELLSWLINTHDGLHMMINDIVKSKNIELLSGGYYSPLFSLIPRKDRVGQIEIMTTGLSKLFGKRSKGMWISERVWEPSMPMTMNNSGMEFTFIDEEFFEDAGLFNGELYSPCLTEDQGKKVVIFPIANRLITQFLLEEPESVVEQIIACGSEEEDRVVSMMIAGEDLDFSNNLKEKFTSFFDCIKNKKDQIEIVLPGKIVRNLYNMRKVYFGCVSPGDIGRWSGPVFREQPVIRAAGYQQENAEVEIENNLEIQGKPVNSQSFFRHFLAKYPESNYLYSKMIYTHNLISKVRGDKQRKKTALTELYKSQNNRAYWHGGGLAGIYSAENRRYAYARLIQAEKTTRERTGFKATLVRDDFDMDGNDEVMYKGLSLNAILHRKSGCLYELDYLRTPHNYFSTMARHNEWYHKDEITDKYTRNSFIDHFFNHDEKNERFQKMEYFEAGDFISKLYNLDKISNVRKEVVLSRFGQIIQEGNKLNVKIQKKYLFKRTFIDVEYEITNISDTTLNTKFGTEINFAFSSQKGRDVAITIVHPNSETKPKKELFSVTNANEVNIKDFQRHVSIVLSSAQKCSVWGSQLFTKTGTGRVVEPLYQFDCFLPTWEINLSPDEVWSNKIQLRFERIQKKKP